MTKLGKQCDDEWAGIEWNEDSKISRQVDLKENIAVRYHFAEDYFYHG